MSLRIPKEYYNYMPSIVASGLDVCLGKTVNQDSPAKEIDERNKSLGEMAQFVVATLAYVGIFHIAPSLGYTIPRSALLVLGLIFPAEALLVIQAYVGVKNIKEAVIQGRAGNTAGIAKSIAMVAIAYFSTTPRSYQLKENFYAIFIPFVRPKQS